MLIWAKAALTSVRNSEAKVGSSRILGPRRNSNKKSCQILQNFRSFAMHDWQLDSCSYLSVIQSSTLPFHLEQELPANHA